MTLTLSAPGTLGSDAGPDSNGVHVGSLAQTALSKGLLESHAQPVLCFTRDGGVYVDETTPANESTGDDVEIVGTTIAADDGIYIGHATKQTTRVDVSISTQGDYTDLVLEWQYWDGDAWQDLDSLVDGTSGFEAAAGVVSVTFDAPTDWEPNTVDNVEGYWIRANVVSVTASVTPMQIGQIWWVAEAGDATWSDDTTDVNDVGTDDVPLLPTYPIVGDSFYVGGGEKFCKVEVVLGQERTGTATLTWEYWDGDSWEALAVIEDKSVGFSAAAGTHVVSFAPPSDWAACTAANGPNGEAGHFVRCRLSALTSVTQQPLATQAFIYPLSTGAVGVPAEPALGAVNSVVIDSTTESATNADSIFLLINCTTGQSEAVTATGGAKTTAVAASVLSARKRDQLVVAQIQEDGTTEFAGVTFYLSS